MSALSIALAPLAQDDAWRGILRRETVAAIVENDGHLSKVDQARAEAPDLHHVWTIDTGGLDDVRSAGAGVSDDGARSRKSSATTGSPTRAINMKPPPPMLPALGCATASA